MITESKNEYQLQNQLWEQIYARSNIKPQGEIQTWMLLEAQLEAKMGDQLFRQLWKKLTGGLLIQLNDHLFTQLDRQLWSQLRG